MAYSNFAASLGSSCFNFARSFSASLLSVHFHEENAAVFVRLGEIRVELDRFVIVGERLTVLRWSLASETISKVVVCFGKVWLRFDRCFEIGQGRRKLLLVNQSDPLVVERGGIRPYWSSS